MEERYFNYFETKLSKLPELRQYHSSIDNPEFEKWWGSITATCERMGAKYAKRAKRIHFFPQILVGGDNSASINHSYQAGLNQAGTFLETLMEELQTWGLDRDESEPSSDQTQEKAFNLYLTVSQHQAQQIIQTIHIDDYDGPTKQKVAELFEELRQKEKNKAKISNIIKWLADKSIDALIAILLAGAKLT